MLEVVQGVGSLVEVGVEVEDYVVVFGILDE